MYEIPHSSEIRTFYCLSTKYILCLSSVGRLNKNRRDGWATSVRPSSPPRPTYLVRWPRCLTRAELLQQPAYLTQGCIMSVPLPRKNLKIWFFFQFLAWISSFSLVVAFTDLILVTFFFRIQKVPRQLVVSQDGYLYIYNLDPNEGGECMLLRQHRYMWVCPHHSMYYVMY